MESIKAELKDRLQVLNSPRENCWKPSDCSNVLNMIWK
jgi:hypothetical protein